MERTAEHYRINLQQSCPEVLAVTAAYIILLRLLASCAELNHDFVPVQAAKEVSIALSLNYPSSSDMASVCGFERPLDR